MNTLVSIYKSNKRDEMYLHVLKKTAVTEAVPEALLNVFGKPIPVFDLLLNADKKLARANAADILQAIATQGFYLQMPPAPQHSDLCPTNDVL